VRVNGYKMIQRMKSVKLTQRVYEKIIFKAENLTRKLHCCYGGPG